MSYGREKLWANRSPVPPGFDEEEARELIERLQELTQEHQAQLPPPTEEAQYVLDVIGEILKDLTGKSYSRLTTQPLQFSKPVFTEDPMLLERQQEEGLIIASFARNGINIITPTNTYLLPDTDVELEESMIWGAGKELYKHFAGGKDSRFALFSHTMLRDVLTERPIQQVLCLKPRKKTL